ncbi:Spindle assembly checkpoint kinase-like protein [Cladobotryum mycophilum]|uniref:EKC/KEOPS complex subunit BUD32 n=1 Tax=Cladobotryum mycophilum TaxID=491253 RepID=A0ABR0SV24_9HYPO
MTSEVPYIGSTSMFCRVKPGVLLQYPMPLCNASTGPNELTERFAHKFLVERQILPLLGSHPRIVPYLGWHDEPGDPQGLLLTESSHGNLQQCLDNNNTITPPIRRKWCLQAVESVAYIHHCGVLHSDLRPDNFLVHATTPTSLDLWLCDFGGSACEKLGVDGGNLPDPGFYDPKSEPVPSIQVDIFSLASIMYAILTGNWPYRTPGGSFKTLEESFEYDRRADDLFRKGELPDVAALYVGDIILKCWKKEYASADDVVQALKLKMQEDSDKY